jgi:hypothetical protein
MTAPTFDRLIRFKTSAGTTFFGEVGFDNDKLLTRQQLVGREVLVYDGKAPWDEGFRLSDRKESMAKVRLCWNQLRINLLRMILCRY